jgi:NADP-dependent 3-hydroxy acid dehydrogenase YdfG
MSSIQSQFLDIQSHHAVYPAIDPKVALKDSAAGKVVFIAGASRGIGQATAVAFAQAGAKALYLTARSREELEKTAALVQAANPQTLCRIAVCDVTDRAAVASARIGISNAPARPDDQAATH